METVGTGYSQEESGVSMFVNLLSITLYQHAFRVFDLQVLVDEPFSGRAATMTDAVLSAAGASSSAHIAVEGEESRMLPDVFEAVLVEIARFKFRCLEEGTRIDFAFGADAAGSCGSSAHIEARQFVAKGVQMEE